MSKLASRTSLSSARHIVLLTASLSLGLANMGCGPKKPATNVPAPVPTAAADPTPPVMAMADAVSEGSDEAFDDANVVKSRIRRVTVYSDRAMITRTAPIKMSQATATLTFRSLPGWVDEDSVRVATSKGKIVDVSVGRRFLARSTDAGFRKVEKAHKALQQRMQSLDDELGILEGQRSHLESLKVFSAAKLSTDVITRDIKIESYDDVVKFVSRSLRETAAARRRVENERDELTPDIAASARNLDELRRLTTLEETTVTVKLQGPVGADSNLTLTYATPGATWEPAHELRVNSKSSNEAKLVSYAVVTQTTGEDWTQAELKFSTQASANAEQIPDLEMLALGGTPQTKRTVTRKFTSFQSAQKKYNAQNRHWNRMNQARSHKQAELERFEKSYSNNLEILERVQNKTVEIFQGLRRRGTTAHYRGLEPTVVRSDGRSVRIPIGRHAIKTQHQIVAAPEESLNAALTLKMVNPPGQPLLPGSLARYRDGAFLGLTDVNFAAGGEDFSVFLSVADQVKLTRVLDRKQSSLVRKTRNRMQLSFITTATNLGDKPKTMVIAERIPVSENRDIRVSNVRVTPRKTADAKGIVKWTITLKPGEKREFRVSYQVDYPPSLIIDVQRRRRNRPKGKGNFAPMPAPKRLDEKLFDFESNL